MGALPRAILGRTEKTHAEIQAWNQQYLKENPYYKFLTCNCQHYVQALFRYLKPFDIEGGYLEWPAAFPLETEMYWKMCTLQGRPPKHGEPQPQDWWEEDGAEYTPDLLMDSCL